MLPLGDELPAKDKSKLFHGTTRKGSIREERDLQNTLTRKEIGHVESLILCWGCNCDS